MTWTRLTDKGLTPADFDIGYYRLDANHEPQKCTVFEWAEALETPVGRPVAVTYLRCGSTTEKVIKALRGEQYDCHVSTVFLGMDHGWASSARPILFETLVCDGPMDGEMDRCCTWDEALQQHEKMVKRVVAAIESRPA